MRLRRISDSDNKSEKRSKEYQNYFNARDYKPSKVGKQFLDIRNISREEPDNLKHIMKNVLLHTI